MRQKMVTLRALLQKLSKPVFEQKLGIDSREPRYRWLKVVIVGGMIGFAGVALVFTVSHAAGVAVFIIGWVIVIIGGLAGVVDLVRQRK